LRALLAHGGRRPEAAVDTLPRMRLAARRGPGLSPPRAPDVKDFLNELGRHHGQVNARRLTESKKANPVQALVLRAEARSQTYKPFHAADRLESFKRVGYIPGGIYMPADADMQLEVRAHLDDLGHMTNGHKREAAYRAYQAETEQWALDGIPGRWTWQQAVARSEARFRIVAWGRRGGKSFHAAREAVSLALARPRSWIWVAAPINKSVGRVFDMVCQLLEDLGQRAEASTWRNIEQEKLIVLHNGSRIEGISLEDDRTAAGTSIDLVVMDESEYLSGDQFRRLVLPTLADKEGKALIISSAQDDETWFWQRCYQAMHEQDAESPWEGFQGATWENFFKFPLGRRSQAIRDAEKESTAAEVAAIYGARPSGELHRVLHQFKERVHVRPVLYDDTHPIVCVADPSGGINEYAVGVYQVWRDRAHQIDEYYQRGVTAGQVAAALDERPWRRNVQVLWVDQGSWYMEVDNWRAAGWPSQPIMVDDPAHPGHQKVGKPDVAESLPVVGALLRDPQLWHQYQQEKLALVLADMGFWLEDLPKLDGEQRLNATIELEERLADNAATERDVERMQQASHYFCDPSCANMRMEAKFYRWRKPRRDDQPLSEKPRDRYNHLADCLRYLAHIYFRHLVQPGRTTSYLRDFGPPPDSNLPLGCNWLEDLRMRAARRSHSPRSYLRSA
jgi:hypothetical protein